MKYKYFSLFYYLLFLLLQIPLHAQTNLNFELGNFTNWKGYTWRYSTDVTSINTSKVEGIVSRRQTIMSDTTAYDANTGYKLKKVPTGYKYSARLGDEIVSSDANPRCWQQSLRYTMTIDSSNALLVFKFACVLQYGSDHTAKVEPRFRLNILDKNGDTITDCSNYDVYATNSNVAGFYTYTPNSSSSGTVSPINWRDWTTVGADLSKYLGETITIEFMATDCTGKYHYGYAYFVAESNPLIITVKYCNGDSAATLTAPDGFETYRWYNNQGVLVDTTQTLLISNPVEGDIYSCTLTSETGCVITLNSTIAEYIPVADFSSYMIDCKSNTVQFTNLSSGTHGTLKYEWNFDDSVTSTLTNPRHTFATSGMHPTTLIVTNPPSTCTDTVSKVVESFSPPLIGISGDSTYCPNLSTTLTGYGAYQYGWSTGSTNDSIEVSSPGGEIWLLGYSSTGCVSDTVYKFVSEEADWDFLSESDTTFCTGDTSLLKVTGAYKYLWNTGDTVNSISVITPGTYSITGSNKRGCEKHLAFNVIEYPLPDVDFTTSPTTLSIKQNQLYCSISDQDGVDFNWDLGDGSSESITSFTHNYSISNYTLQYNINLTATSEHACVDSVTKTIYVVPFIPNVFTPNGDGVNDVFMAGLDIQVFDRNGLLIYKGTEGWDGKYKGKFMDPDTYFYTISYTYNNQQKHVQKGYITLVQ
jgi:gliding motility-associated-like protein